MKPEFKLRFYQGDTPALVCRLKLYNQMISLQGFTCKLAIQDNVVTGQYADGKVTFTISKTLADTLKAGVSKAWILFTSTQKSYTYEGLVHVMYIGEQPEPERPCKRACL